MATKERVEDLDESELPRDRRVSTLKGDIDVSDLDPDDLGRLREEEINNLNPDELDLLEAQTGVMRRTEDEVDLLRHKLGFSDPDPLVDRDKSRHSGMLRYGNEAMAIWA